MVNSYDDVFEMLKRFGELASGSGADGETIGEAESSLGVPINGGYRVFLERFGWAAIGGLEIYGLGLDVPRHLDLVKVTFSERQEMEPSLPFSLVPVMNDGFGDLFCIDTRIDSEPPVVFWEHSAGPRQVVSVESEDFASWLGAQLDELT